MTQKTDRSGSTRPPTARRQLSGRRSCAATQNINLYHSTCRAAKPRRPAPDGFRRGIGRSRASGDAGLHRTSAATAVSDRDRRPPRRRRPTAATHAGAAPAPHRPRSAPGSTRDEQPAGRLRVVSSVERGSARSPRQRRDAAPKCSRLVRPPPGMFPPTSVAARPRAAAPRAASISSVQPLATAISDAWPIRPKPVMSVHACTAPPAAPRAPRRRPGSASIIDATAASTAVRRRAAELQRGRDDARCRAAWSGAARRRAARRRSARSEPDATSPVTA